MAAQLPEVLFMAAGRDEPDVDPAGGRMAAQLPEVLLFMAAGRDEPDVDAEAFRRYAFHIVLLVTSALVYVVGNPGSSSFAAEDVLTLFLFWNILLVIFLACFVPRFLLVVARIVGLVAEALRTYLFGNRAVLLF